MNIDACIRIGRVIKSHGVKGEVRVDLELKNPNEYKDQESVYIEIDGKLIPFFIESLKLDGTSAILKFEGIGKPDDASLIINRSIYIEKKDLVNEDKSLLNTVSDHNLITGYQVVDINAGMLGTVTGIEEGPQDRLVIFGERGEILIPIVETIILEVDQQSEKIRVDLPEGFLDIYET